MSHPIFVEGKYDIQFVEKYFKVNHLNNPSDKDLAASLIAAFAYNSTLAGENGVSRERAITFRRWKNNRLEE